MSRDSERQGGTRDGARPVRLPRSPTVLVGKSALTALLDRHEPLTVLCAPKGYGKTALVSSWARQRTDEVDLVWVSCRIPSMLPDGMPASFWARLADEMWRAGLSSVEPGLTPGRSDVVAALAGRSAPLCVVVDDFDDNTDPHVSGELLELVRRFDTLDVVVLARSPRTAESLLASTVDSVVLGPADLLLSVDDAAGLVAALGHELSGDAVQRLVRDTGGWPALLRAVLIGSVASGRSVGRARSDTRSQRPTHLTGAETHADRAVLHAVGDRAQLPVDLRAGFPYLRAVWDETDDRGMRRFVQLTGLLTTFTVDDAVWSTGLRDAARYVGALVDLGLLVQDADGEGARFRYVEAVRLAATEIFRLEEPRRFRVAQRRLARMRTAQGRVGEAVGHLLEARTWEACAELVDLHWTSLVAEHPDVVALVVESVPDEVLARHPRLGVARTHLLPVLRPRPRRTEGGAGDEVRRLPEVGPRGAPQQGEGLAQVLGSMEEGLRQIVTLRLTGDFGAATTLAERAQDGLGPYLDQADAAAKGELAPLLYEWAVTRLLGADVDGALAAFRQSADLARSVDRPVVLREAAVGAALCCALLGFLDQAEEWLLDVPAGLTGQDGRAQEGRGVRTVRSIVALERFEPEIDDGALLAGDLGAASGLGTVAIAVRAQAALRDGTHYEALAEVEAARENLEGTTATKSLREALLAAAAVDLYLGLGYVSKARAAVAGTDRRYELVGLACARTDLVAGDFEDAVERCAALLGTRLNGPRLRLDLLLVLAAAELGLGHRHEAAVALEEATGICRATGLLRSFLKVPREVLEDLVPLVPGVRAVLDAPGFADAVSVFPSESPRTRLSGREMQVLRSLAESPSLASVARSLFLSSNTVKTHLRSIYQKLGTHSSIETVERARDLGLLDDPPAGPSTARRVPGLPQVHGPERRVPPPEGVVPEGRRPTDGPAAGLPGRGRGDEEGGAPGDDGLPVRRDERSVRGPGAPGGLVGAGRAGAGGVARPAGPVVPPRSAGGAEPAGSQEPEDDVELGDNVS